MKTSYERFRRQRPRLREREVESVQAGGRRERPQMDLDLDRHSGRLFPPGRCAHASPRATEEGVERDGRHPPEQRPIHRQLLESLVLARVLTADAAVVPLAQGRENGRDRLRRR